ncbi:hypothetical protein FHETE_3707 [Fusarium heterosporum]|uniref:Uncharacterized protein n=1 Tax=Fusarium heterosporum TaxID=42747 RepID=A0A8H5WW95_FUSHE|nr:hypothetical protein FHETE_3707 [Fusarium heterosporum]
MKATTAEDRRSLSRELLSDTGSFVSYFQNYDDLATKDNIFSTQGSSPPRDHNDVLSAAELLKMHPRITREAASSRLQAAWNTYTNIESTLALAVQALIMTDSSAQDWHPAGFSLGDYRPISWLSQEPFVSFVERSYSRTANSRFKEDFTAKSQLKAWKLQKRLGITFRLTDNLSEHLILDVKNNTLYLFHQVAYLKAHLARYQHVPSPLDVPADDSLKCGTLPPQLLVETLYTLQGILFPSLDKKSGDVLNALIRRDGFDPECAQYEGYKIFSEPPEHFQYVYWGKRIAQLHELVKSRPPRNKAEKWFQQKTSERNALLIALLALFISIFVGILSIILGAVQVWIAWMAWKHPVRED